MLPFLLLGHTAARARRPERLIESGQTEQLIAFGPLFAEDGDDEDGDDWVGTAVIGEFADAAAAREVLTSTGLYDDVEVHNWTFGGRR